MEMNKERVCAEETKRYIMNVRVQNFEGIFKYIHDKSIHHTSLDQQYWLAKTIVGQGHFPSGQNFQVNHGCTSLSPIQPDGIEINVPFAQNYFNFHFVLFLDHHCITTSVFCQPMRLQIWNEWKKAIPFDSESFWNFQRTIMAKTRSSWAAFLANVIDSGTIEYNTVVGDMATCETKLSL